MTDRWGRRVEERRERARLSTERRGKGERWLHWAAGCWAELNGPLWEGEQATWEGRPSWATAGQIPRREE